MLMYGFQLRVAIDVNIHDDELQRTQNFLRDMQYMLHIARDNIKTTQDRPRFNAYHNRQPHVFNIGQKVFLCVPHNSKILSTSKCAKLAHGFVDLSQPRNALVHQPIISRFLMVSKSIQFFM